MNIPNDDDPAIEEFVASLNERYWCADPSEILDIALAWAPGAIAFANSFGLEDVVLQHMLLNDSDKVETFVLDTGRLPAETYDLIDRWRLRYGLQFKLLSPQSELLEPFVERHGPNAFYESTELRKSCCAIRKLEPLRRALAGKGAWITGLRKQQSSTRAVLDVFELDQPRRLKVSPLANWSLDQVWDYIRTHDLPYNKLHDQGYPSLGCAPCTRAIAPGEDIRAGRWWWEVNEHRECGLHFAPKEPRPSFDSELQGGAPNAS